MVKGSGHVLIAIMDQAVEHSVSSVSRQSTVLGNGFCIGKNTLAKPIERNLAQFLELLPVTFEDRHDVLLREILINAKTYSCE
jgi:hypothetical protein